MTERDEGVYLRHMLETARKVAARVRDLSRAEYDADEDLRLALLHLIQTLGEGARHVSARTREAHPAIPWRNIIGMRHKVEVDAQSDVYALGAMLYEVLCYRPPYTGRSADVILDGGRAGR